LGKLWAVGEAAVSCCVYKWWIVFKLLSLKMWKSYQYICLEKYFHKNINISFSNKYLFIKHKSKLCFENRLPVPIRREYMIPVTVAVSSTLEQGPNKRPYPKQRAGALLLAYCGRITTDRTQIYPDRSSWEARHRRRDRGCMWSKKIGTTMRASRINKAVCHGGRSLGGGSLPIRRYSLRPILRGEGICPRHLSLALCFPYVPTEPKLSACTWQAPRTFSSPGVPACGWTTCWWFRWMWWIDGSRSQTAGESSRKSRHVRHTP
jgi:hypothetical protein